MKRAVWRGVVLFVSLVLVSTPVVAQVLYGSIVGTVTDEANLAVPGATVTITHAETNQARETTSNETGELYVPERRRRHLSGGRHAAGISIVPRAGHRGAAEHGRPRRCQADGRRAVRSRCSCRPIQCCSRPKPRPCRRRRRASSCRTCRSTDAAFRACSR